MSFDTLLTMTCSGITHTTRGKSTALENYTIEIVHETLKAGNAIQIPAKIVLIVLASGYFCEGTNSTLDDYGGECKINQNVLECEKCRRKYLRITTLDRQK